MENSSQYDGARKTMTSTKPDDSSIYVKKLHVAVIAIIAPLVFTAVGVLLSATNKLSKLEDYVLTPDQRIVVIKQYHDLFNQSLYTKLEGMDKTLSDIQKRLERIEIRNGTTRDK
jgi:hypothetical protein